MVIVAAEARAEKGPLPQESPMRIAEIFRSLQGEGLLAGTPSVFVRASGCNLRCGFCDTPYASWYPEGKQWTVERIVGRVVELAGASASVAARPDAYGSPAEPCRHVVLTGGEPMLFADLVPLSGELRRRGFHVTIETAGTRYLPVVCDLMSVSPKLSNSTPSPQEHPQWSARHERRRQAPEVLRRLVAEYAYQIKFVIDTPADCEEAERYLAGFPEIDRSRVMFMPQGTEQSRLEAITQWLAPYCQKHGWRFCPRRHIGWFGYTRGT